MRITFFSKRVFGSSTLAGASAKVEHARDRDADSTVYCCCRGRYDVGWLWFIDDIIPDGGTAGSDRESHLKESVDNPSKRCVQ